MAMSVIKRVLFKHRELHAAIERSTIFNCLRKSPLIATQKYRPHKPYMSWLLRVCAF